MFGLCSRKPLSGIVESKVSGFFHKVLIGDLILEFSEIFKEFILKLFQISLVVTVHNNRPEKMVVVLELLDIVDQPDKGHVALVLD
jgi:hypothetical protein